MSISQPFVNTPPAPCRGFPDFRPSRSLRKAPPSLRPPLPMRRGVAPCMMNGRCRIDLATTLAFTTPRGRTRSFWSTSTTTIWTADLPRYPWISPWLSRCSLRARITVPAGSEFHGRLCIGWSDRRGFDSRHAGNGDAVLRPPGTLNGKHPSPTRQAFQADLRSCR